MFIHGNDGVGLVMCSAEDLPAFLKLLSDGHQRVKKKKRPSKIHLEMNCRSRTSGIKPYLGASLTACKGPTGMEATC